MPSITQTPAVVRANGDATREMVTYGWFSFRRMGVLVPFKGDLAYDYLTVAALNPAVIEISKTVAVLQWFDGTDWRDHAPRYAVHRRGKARMPDSVLHVDVVWSWEFEKNETKYKRLKKDAAEKNLHYCVFTEKQIRAYPRLVNAKIVQKFASDRTVSSDAVDAVLRFADGREDFSVNELVEAGVLSYADAYGCVLHLVANGRMTFPIGRRRFDGACPVSWRVH